MVAEPSVDSLETLIRLSVPAKVYIGADVAGHSWPMADQFLRTWQGLKGDKAAPARAALKPMKVGDAMPFLTIFDVSYDPFRMKCRLMGSAFVQAIGYDATGNFACDYPNTDLLIRRAKWIAAKVQPMLITGLPLEWSPEKSYKTYDTLCLPFLGPEDSVDAILYLNRFHASGK